MQDCNTTQTTLQKREPDQDEKWDRTRVFQMSDQGTPTFSLNVRERPSSRENDVDRSNRSLIVPEPEELR